MVDLAGSPLRPRWVYNDGSAVDYLMSVPQRPWGFGSRGVGGSDISAAGVPAAFEIRRDHLLHLTLRFPESEWDDVERLVRHLQLAGSATFYPDQDDTSVLHLVYGESPALGDEILPRRSDFPSVLELDVTVRRTTDAIFIDPYFGDLLFHWEAGTRADGMTFDHYNIIGEGDLVSFCWVAKGKHKSGKSIEFKGIDVVRITDGKIAEIWVSYDLVGIQNQLK